MPRSPVYIACFFAALASPLLGQTPGVLREVWTSIDGSSVANLTLSPNFPGSPILRVVDPEFRSPVDWNDRYGVRMRAYLTPTVAANYTFWVSGDDNCELWLSPDEDPAHRVKIATVTSYTAPQTWNTYAEQKSAPVSLQAGQRYYVEALMKEGSGGDSLAVAWATSPSATPQVIPGANLTPFEVPAAVTGTVVVKAGKAVTLYAPNSSVVLTAQALNLAKPTAVPPIQWSQVSGAAAGLGTPSAASTRVDLPGAGTYVFRATATTTANGTGSDDVTVTVLPKLAPDAGSALAEYWFGVSGSTVASLANSLDYPNFPHAHRSVTSLTSPNSLGDQFGERTRGFILVPTTGSYRFYVAGNDAMEFYLSSDATPANLQLRASANKSMGNANDFSNPAQDSGAIQLTAGQRYAFEVRRKEDSGSDYFSVLWQQPGVNYLTDITGEFLAPPADNVAASAATQEFDPALDFALNAGRDQVLYLPRTTISLNAYETRRVSGSDTPTRVWKQVSGPTGAQFSATATAATTVTFPKVGTYVLRYSVTTTRNTTSDDVKIEVRAALNASTGYLTRQVWWNRSFASIDAMKADSAFPNAPDIVDNFGELRQSNDWANLYGTRITGILVVPGTGTTPVNFTFYVAGDDVAEFSISTDTTAAKLQRVCYTTKATGRENWTVEASQTSVPVALKPGGRYLVELLHKETWSSDYFAVAWSREGDRRPTVIDGAYFEPVLKTSVHDANLNCYANAGRDRTYYWPHDRTRLAGSVIKVRDGSATPTTTWKQLSGPKSTIAEPARLDTEVTFTAVGTYTFELTATEGTVNHRDTMVIQVLNPIAGVTGYLTRSVWLDVGGYTLADLTAYDATLSYPHYEDLLPGTEPPTNWTDYYGTRLKGYLTVPTAGSYTFWIASDDASELKLDLGDGNGLKRIAYLTYAVGVRSWDSYASQKSVTLSLQAGVRYPIEVLQKEGGGDDHLAVAMNGPATNGREVLSRGFLTPDHNAPLFNPEIMVTLGSDRTLLWPTSSVVLAALVYDLKQGPKALTYQWSSTSTKVTFENQGSPVSGVKFSAPGVYEVKVVASDGTNSGSDTLLVTVRNPLNAKSGGILREAWTGVPGYYLSDLRNSSAYAGAPKFTDVLSNFEAPTNWGDSYGQRLTGFIQVPTEGDYVFLIASDDESELWFNPAGEASAGVQKIAFTTYATGRYNWSRYPSQQSAVVHLVPGKRYYIQALHKEGGSEDYLAVAYRRSDQPNSAAVVIPGVLLSPPDGTTAASFDGQISVRAGDPQSGVWPRNRYSLRGTAVDYVPGPQALAYRWSVASAPSGSATAVLFNSPTALNTDVEFPQAGSYQLQLTATDGLVTRSDTLTITIAAPLAAGTGSILCETFKGITGGWVTDLVKSPKFPNSPDDRVRLKSAEIPSNQGDNYGMLIRGYLYPPVTGVYRFNLASDEWSEAWLSTDRTPELKELACFVPAATDYYEWRRFPEYQLSRPIKLEKGKSYYIEIRFKESGWRDHLALAWLRPGSTAFEVIDGAYLAPWLLPDAQPPTLNLNGGSEVTLEVGQTFTDPGFTALDLVDGNVNARVTTEGTVDVSTPGTYIIRYTVRDASGNPTVVTRRVNVVVAAGQQPVYPPDASGSHPTTPWTPPATLSDQEVSRFLKQATFGPDDASIARVKQIGMSAWIDEQLALPPTLHLPHMDRIASYQTAKNSLMSLARTADTLGLPGSMMPMASSLSTDDRLWTWWTHAMTAPDQLRQRVAFALSEILVISDKAGTLRNYPRGCANYYDFLVKRVASGSTYRDLLEDVTFNPMMGTWLTMVRSSKARPDENYPREIMQLFSIGLEHLNKDGTFKRDSQGNAVPSYGQSEILELSRTFTGWTYNKSPAFTWSNGADETNPMMSFEEYHDRGRKTILGGATIPAGQTAPQDVRRALDIIAAHPNVGPFMAKRLIQRLVTSNPSAAYIYRVASKWDNNGRGVRGDLCAVTKAILLDPEARTLGTGPNAGKLSEPVLRLGRLLRAFATPPSDNPPVLGRYLMWNADEELGQWPMQSPTVFNFFHTDFKPTGPLMDAGLNAPEFEITTELTTVDTSNYFFEGAYNGFYTNAGPRAVMNYTSLTSLWSTPDLLLARIENLLLGRPLSAPLRASLLNLHTLHSASPTQGVRVMMQVLTSSPEFSVDR